MRHDLERILNPRSVAIVGASRDPLKFSHAYLAALMSYGYRGRLYCVNPNARSILNLKCYKSIFDIPDDLDLGVVFTPRQAVNGVVHECVEKKVRGLAIISPGFGESETSGSEEERELVARARRKGVRIIGPNCLGLFSAKMGFEGTYAGPVPKGNVGLVFQSGNLIKSIVYPSRRRKGFGFSHMVSLGNQADLEFHECINYLRNDPDTKAIGLYIEGLKNGRKFIEEITETVKIKPVVVLKVGRSKVGARLTQSHTASLAGSDELYSAAFRQSGAIRVDWPSELVSLLHAFTIHKLPRGNSVGIMSDGGGDATVVADNCEGYGLSVVKLSQEKQRRLRLLAPQISKIDNPLDFGTAQAAEAATLVPKLAREILKGREVDALLLVGGFAGEEFVYEGMRKFDRLAAKEFSSLAKCAKPIIFQSLYAVEEADSFTIMRKAGFYIYTDHAEAVRCLSALSAYASIKRTFGGASFKSDRQNEGRGTLRIQGTHKNVPEPDAVAFLGQYGIRFPESRLAEDVADAVRYSEEIGYPVVLKVVSPDVIHKTEAGGVKLGLRNRFEVEEAFKLVLGDTLAYHPGARISGVTVSKMVEGGVEIIVGGIDDKTFGPCVMFGFGGTLVELLRNFSFRIAPIERSEAAKMIAEVRGHEILTGFRGGRVYDTSALEETILTIAKIMEDEPGISQVELNPMSVQEKGAIALDARIIMR